MTTTREVMVLATTPEDAMASIEAERWGHGVTVTFMGAPKEVMAVGLPAGTHLYEVRVVFRFTR